MNPNMSGRPRFRRVLMSAGALLFAGAGCSIFSPVDESYHHKKAGLRVDLPQGWLRFNPRRPDYVMTRDGLRLEMISLQVIRMGKQLAGTDRVYQPDMLPYEVAELSLRLWEDLDETKNFEIERIESVKLAGHDGYKADALFTDTTGLRKRLRVYGAPIGDYVCEFSYEAAQEVYFDKYGDVFEQLVASARSAE